jgi:hypothetical protein
VLPTLLVVLDLPRPSAALPPCSLFLVFLLSKGFSQYTISGVEQSQCFFFSCFLFCPVEKKRAV